ncbi:MAG: cytochrome d ubiquinol oxidase subunit II [Saprospiraceae bacterium]|nr:cytochrome d ubiquinol oxidase subunit II [Saprospiraceae bacterium]MCB9326092.1 cytochrome d ubiquinol oxidase subunit II [Lewinellaceae bacterium]
MIELWFILLVFMLSMFVILDGFDFGAGIIHLFVAKTEKEKQQAIRAIGPFWDANEVWLIAGGGVLFMAFPKYYAASFSGFYLSLIIVLWLLILRGIGMELRNLLSHQMWHTLWDKVFGMSSLLLALFFGTAMGNVIRGANLGGVAGGISKYEPHNFFLPLWNHQFSPLHQDPGVLDWFTISIGFIAALTLTIHGANWILYKTDGDLNIKLQKIVPKLLFALIPLLVLSLIEVFLIKNYIFENYAKYPVLFLFPIAGLAGLAGIFYYNKKKAHGKAFMSSAIFIMSGLASNAVGLFPKLLPSTNSINEALTIYNSGSTHYGLSVAIVWWLVAVVLVIIYFTFVHRIFRGKIDESIHYEH